MRAIGGGCASDIRKEQPRVLWLSIGSFYGGCWTEGEKREEKASRTARSARGEERETQPDEERSEGGAPAGGGWTVGL